MNTQGTALVSRAPQAIRRACIDVGTNSVKLLVGDVSGSLVQPVLEQSKQTRLGSGFYETHRLQQEPIAKTAEAIAVFTALARELNAESVRIVGTSAVRDAINGIELIDAVRDATGQTIEVISGTTEADWVFKGVTTDPTLAQCRVLILDVGGGSTEFVVGQNSVQQYRNSFQLGSVRLLEKLRLEDPPGLRALENCRMQLRRFMEENIAPLITPALSSGAQPLTLVGTGGTATILARIEAKMEDFERGRIESTRVGLGQLRGELERQWQMSLAERRNIVGLPPNRADVILTGMAIYEMIMERFGLDTLRISTRGLRYAALFMP